MSNVSRIGASHATQKIVSTGSSKICNDSYLVQNPRFLQIYRGTESFIMATAITLNIAIIAIVISNRRLHTIPHVLKASLAVSDVISSCSYGIIEFVLITEDIICVIPRSFKCARMFLIPFGIISNIFNHLLISTERWLYIARPFLHQRIVTQRTTVCSLILVWTASVFTNINMVTSKCGILTLNRSVNLGVIGPSLHVILSLFMISIYAHITYITRRAVQKINKCRPMDVQNSVLHANKPLSLIKATRKNVRMLIIVFGTFFISLTPTMCSDFYAYLKDHGFYRTILGKSLDLFWSAHCCINFFVYTLQDKLFCEVLRKCLTKLCEMVSQRRQMRIHSMNEPAQICTNVF